MLSIKLKDGQWRHWWLGMPVPVVGRVVEFQVDGDELNLFLDAMEATRHPVEGVAYTKLDGFHEAYPAEEV